jgi:ParB family chromosome partitioning protein
MSKNTPSTDYNEPIKQGDTRKGAKEAGAVKADAFLLPIDEIFTLPGFNPRVEGKDYDAHIKALADSIIANGFLPGKPLTVHAVEEEIEAEDGTKRVETLFYVVDGHSRFAAAKQAIERGADLKALPVIPTPADTSLADLTVQTVLNNNSTRPLTPLELAAVVKRLMNYEMPKADIAARLSITARYIDDLLLLLAAPAPVLSAVRSGKVSATLAIQEIRQHGEKAAERISTAVVAAAPGKRVTAKALPKTATAAAKAKPAKTKAKVKDAIAAATSKTKTPAASVAPTSRAPSNQPASDVDFYRGAIEYALSLPKKGGGGLDWLKAFMADDAAATGEVERWLGQPAGAFFDATLRVPVDTEGL